MTGTLTVATSPVARYCDHGHSAEASSTTSSRKDLLIVPCSVMRSELSAGRGRPSKVRSFRPGLPDFTGRLLRVSKAMAADSLSRSRRGGAGDVFRFLVALDQRIRGMIVDGLEILALDDVGGNARLAIQAGRHVAYHVLDELGVVI